MKRSVYLSILAAIVFAAPAVSAQALQPGEVLFGAAKINIAPTPNPALGEYWEQDADACNLGPGLSPIHAADTRTPWPENPNCIYAGGFGIGPMNALTSFDDEYGLWVRSVAISDGVDTVVLTLIDGIYWMGRYRNFCDRCGWFSLAEDLGAELQIEPKGFIFSATHSHASPDFIGGWGGVPQWYMDQVADSIRNSVRQAVGNMEPATLEVGDELARGFNRDRRDIYWSPEENTLSWFRATDRGGDTIATIGAYARHPTSQKAPVAHADWHGPFSKRAEERFGGIAIGFPSGLGNLSNIGGTAAGASIADILPAPGEGQPVVNPDVRARQTKWVQPVTNSALTALGANGFFDRPFVLRPTEAAIMTGKSQPELVDPDDPDLPNPGSLCRSASTLTVETAISAVRIGNLTITGGPGELFSNITNTIREDEFEAGQIAIPLALANDALGYIMQNFEYNAIGGQAVGFVADGAVGYEDAYAIDGCFGTKVLEETLRALKGL